MDTELEACPMVNQTLPIKAYHSAAATFHAPSDLSGIGGMHRECIRAMPRWQNGPGQYDCVFVEKDPEVDGFKGLHIACVKLFISFVIDGITYPCALVDWFSQYGVSPCEDTGLWRVQPDFDGAGRRVCSIIHIDTILHAAHLIGIAGAQILPRDFTHHDALDSFRLFYVNKFADHHAHEIAR